MSLKLVHRCATRSLVRLSASASLFRRHSVILRTPSSPGGRLAFALESIGSNASIDSHALRYSTSSTRPEGLDIPRSSIAEALTACPGCGALAQILEAGVPGYYSASRRAVGSYVTAQTGSLELLEDAAREEDVFAQALNRADASLLNALDIEKSHDADVALSRIAPVVSDRPPPLCDRCHQLLHHHQGEPIQHPSLQSIHDTISDSPYKYNHIYHVIDAADFPLSLIPRIHQLLEIAPQRSKNRRSKHAGYHHGKKTELSFIITRSDLLAPTKEQVDKLMPYLVQVLRDALGYAGKDVRLGNVRCVSAKRGWWTRELKADIWKRGGGGWMVGKVNVGKSNLFEVAFPKGETEDINFDRIRSQARIARPRQAQEQFPDADDEFVLDELNNDLGRKAQDVSTDLLPPARMETPYPIMPTVSSLPGTTASPIRIPFGGGKGELIDLPGLNRGDLEVFVQPEHRLSLMMKSRLSPEQFVIRADKTLLLGGVFRFESVSPDIDILAYPFTNLKPHLTSKLKAKEMLSGERRRTADITTPAASEKMESAGRFKLKWDVTKLRAGPLTRASAVGLKASRLPFQVFSADVLLEGVGWVELVAQVRRRSRANAMQSPLAGSDRPFEDEVDVTEDIALPEVEVFSPEGRFVGIRQSMNAWMLGGHGSKSKPMQKGRPRKSMAGSKSRRL